ncbi:MAG: thioredoxin [Clostridiales bacterium]|nr:thioredoxin [Clostridiales bacterium]
MKETNTQNFNSDVANGLTVVDFWAPWCGPCRSQTPILEQFAQKHAGRVNVLKVNTDENGDLAKSYGIMSIPTIMVFQDGNLINRTVGVQSIENLEKLAGL